MKNTDLKTNFGIKLKYLRLKKGFTQEQLAEKLVVASHYISDIECGRRNITIETVEKIDKNDGKQDGQDCIYSVVLFTIWLLPLDSWN
mgnify:CR=1 FL=1